MVRSGRPASRISGSAATAVVRLRREVGFKESIVRRTIKGALQWPGQQQDAKLIAESVPRLLRMVQLIDERRRAEVLIVIANALPN
jgi:hypothetical protein